MKLEKQDYYKETTDHYKEIIDHCKESNDNININDILFNNDETEITFDPKNTKIESKYDYLKKMNLVKKINKIKKKEYLINIFKIITKDSKDFSENNNGVFIFFHNLSDVNLCLYLNKSTLN